MSHSDPLNDGISFLCVCVAFDSFFALPQKFPNLIELCDVDSDSNPSSMIQLNPSYSIDNNQSVYKVLPTSDSSF